MGGKLYGCMVRDLILESFVLAAVGMNDRLFRGTAA